MRRKTIGWYRVGDGDEAMSAGRVELSIAELRHWYIDEGLSTLTIGQQLGVHEGRVRRALIADGV